MDKSLAQIGYEAYGEKAEWKAFNGQAMPQWHELPEHIREKWMEAAEAIEVEVNRRRLGG